MARQGAQSRDRHQGYAERQARDVARTLADLDALIKEAKPIGALNDPKVQSLLKALAHQPDNPNVRTLLEARMDPYRIADFEHPNEFRQNSPPGQQAFPGDIVLADLEGMEWRIEADDGVHHCLIVGPSGSGKTSLILSLVAQLLGGRTC